MIRSNDGSMDEMILEMWKEGVQSVQCKCKDKISYEDFQCFFKGNSQTQQAKHRNSIVKMRRESLKELSSSNHLTFSRSKNFSSMSDRLLASTFALDLSESQSNSFANSFREEDFNPEALENSEKMGNLRSPSRRRRSSSSAILIQSRGSLEWFLWGQKGPSSHSFEDCIDYHFLLHARPAYKGIALHIGNSSSRIVVSSWRGHEI